MHGPGMGEQARLEVDLSGGMGSGWARPWASHNPVPPGPAVHVGREVLPVAAMGSGPGSGPRVKAKAAATRETVWPTACSNVAGGGSIALAAFPHSVDVVRLPRTPPPIRFHTARLLHACG